MRENIPFLKRRKIEPRRFQKYPGSKLKILNFGLQSDADSVAVSANPIKDLDWPIEGHLFTVSRNSVILTLF